MYDFVYEVVIFCIFFLDSGENLENLLYVEVDVVSEVVLLVFVFSVD